MSQDDWLLKTDIAQRGSQHQQRKTKLQMQVCGHRRDPPQESDKVVDECIQDVAYCSQVLKRQKYRRRGDRGGTLLSVVSFGPHPPPSRHSVVSSSCFAFDSALQKLAVCSMSRCTHILHPLVQKASEGFERL